MKILKFSVGVMMTNCYFLVDTETMRCALVDPGDDAEMLLGKIAEKGLTVEKILLTHAHFDHIMALPQIRKATGAPLYVHSEDKELLLDNEKNCMRRFGEVDLPMDPPEFTFEDGEVIPIGKDSVTVMHTPGHTRGSCCFIAGEEMLTGDTLFRGCIGRHDLWGGSYATLSASLEKLKGLETDYKIYPGHGTTSRLFFEKENNIYLL